MWISSGKSASTLQPLIREAGRERLVTSMTALLSGDRRALPAAALTKAEARLAGDSNHTVLFYCILAVILLQSEFSLKHENTENFMALACPARNEEKSSKPTSNARSCVFSQPLIAGAGCIKPSAVFEHRLLDVAAACARLVMVPILCFGSRTEAADDDVDEASVKFRPQKYRWVIALFGAIIIFGMALVVVLAVELSRKNGS